MPSETVRAAVPNSAAYSIFGTRQKALIIAIVTIAATFTAFASNIYFPAIPTIARELDVSTELITLSVTSYLIFQGLAPSLWGPISDAKGRRVAYGCTFVVFFAACVGLASLRNYATLVVLRCLQSTGSASTIAIGSGVLADITTREERGGYMGIFQAGTLVPVAVGPVIGGALAGALGWRSIFWFLAIYSGVFLICLVILLPETLRSIVSDGSARPTSWVSRYPLEMYKRFAKIDCDHITPPLPARRSIDVVEPFRILINKQAAPLVIFMAVYYAVWQMCITAMSTLFATRYGLNETQIGLSYIANGVGTMVGTFISGKILDHDYRKVKAKFNDKRAASTSVDGAPLNRRRTEIDFPLEEARLRLMPVFAAISNIAVLMFGWSIAYPDRVSIAVPIAATFLSGWTAISAQAVTMTYLIDCFSDRSATVSATVNLARCLCAAGGTSFILPMINGIGAGLAFTVCAIVQVLTYGLVLVQVRFAGKWRQEADDQRTAISMEAQPKG